MNKLTPQQLIKLNILWVDAKWQDQTLPEEMTGDEIDQLYEVKNEDYGLQDASQDVRCGESETGLPAGFSRHYESKSVAIKIDGQWVGWTYWYGGGKHSEPEAIEWICDAYFIDCVEEEKVVTVRTFTKAEEVSPITTGD